MKSRIFMFAAAVVTILAASTVSQAADKKAPAEFDVVFKTSKGDVTIHVTRKWAPKGADRFYTAVKAGFYDGCRFFRVLPGFVV